MRDLPPMAGAIIYARQIERHLHTYMKRVEDVLGKGWCRRSKAAIQFLSSGCRAYPFSTIATRLTDHTQIDRLNLKGSTYQLVMLQVIGGGGISG
jgi:hypothetical protein